MIRGPGPPTVLHTDLSTSSAPPRGHKHCVSLDALGCTRQWLSSASALPSLGPAHHPSHSQLVFDVNGLPEHLWPRVHPSLNCPCTAHAGLPAVRGAHVPSMFHLGVFALLFPLPEMRFPSYMHAAPSHAPSNVNSLMPFLTTSSSTPLILPQFYPLYFSHWI